MITPARSFAILISISMLLALGCAGDKGAGPGQSANNTGTIYGQVQAPHANGYVPVPGAIAGVVGGPSAVADASGSFKITGVTPGQNIVVKVSGPQSADPTYPLVHSTHHVVTSVDAGGEAQIFPYLVIGCSRIFDAGAGATIDLAPCGGGGDVTLTFEPGDLAKPDGTPFNGEVRVDIAVLDPAAGGHIAAFSRGDETDAELGGVFGGVEVRLSEADNGNPLRVAAGQSVTTSMELADLTGTNPADLKLQSFDETTNEWVDEPAGMVKTIGPKSFYEYEATHYSGIRAIIGGGSMDRTCIRLRAQLPGSQVWLISGFTTELRGNRRWYVLPGPTDCLDVPYRPLTTVRLRYVAPWDGSVWETPSNSSSAVPDMLQCGGCYNFGDFDFEMYQVAGTGFPIAQFDMNPAPASIGESVAFDGTLSTDDSGIIAYRWDVDGDGLPERYGPIVQYTYDTPGFYDVQLQVVDLNSNAATRTKQLQVVDPNAGGDPTLTVQIVGRGSVVSAPAGISCSSDGGTCAYQFTPGAFIELTPTAYPGFTLDSMTGCNDQDPGRCYVVLDSDRLVTITFVESALR